MPLQHGIDWAPIDARAFHPDMRDTSLRKPGTQRHQIAGHGRKRPHLLGRPNTRRTDQTARHHRLLMHIQPGTPLNHHLHHRLLSIEGDRDAAGTNEILPRVLPVSGGDKEWYLYAARDGLLIGAASHRRLPSLNTATRVQAVVSVNVVENRVQFRWPWIIRPRWQFGWARRR
jgi:hypothetical protein